MKKKLLIVGAGGLGREVVDMLPPFLNGGRQRHDVAFLDDSLPAGTRVHGIDVLGDRTLLRDFSREDTEVCVAIGSPQVRKKVIEEIQALGFSFATIVDPTSVVRSTAVLGTGVIVGARTFLSCNTIVGAHAVLNPGAIVGHDVVIGPYVVVGGGANISGGARIGEGSLVGAGACILAQTSIGNWCKVGMGAAVYATVPDGLTVVGNPARPLPVPSKPSGESGLRHEVPVKLSP